MSSQNELEAQQIKNEYKEPGCDKDRVQSMQSIPGIQPIRADADEKIDRKLMSHLIQMFVKTFGCFATDCTKPIFGILTVYGLTYFIF